MNMRRCLLVLALAGAWPSPALQAQTGTSVRTIAITAKRFEFTPKEVHLKKGETVTLALSSEDVTHGLLCRGLKVDADIPKGKATEVVVTPQKAGEFPAICNHFCGGGHAGMKMKFVVEE
jgi:cytochrome c oxidase subunit II